MRIVNLLCFLFFFVPPNAFSQSQSTSHAFQLQFEALGPGASSSFNIDSRLTKKENGIGFRAGIGITPLGWLKDACDTGSLNSFPVGTNYLVGKSQHLLEFGAGAVLSFMSGTKFIAQAWKKAFLVRTRKTIGLHRSDTGISVCTERA